MNAIIRAILVRAAVGPAVFMLLLLGEMPIMASAQSLPQSPPIETGCRRSNSTTGVYAQPSLDSTSRGILSSGQIVQLELVGSGTGWSRINQPVVGWVEAKYLTGSSCTGPSSSLPAQSTPSPTTAPIATQVTKTVKVVCEVMPSEGLAVRRQPATTSDVLSVIPKGPHQFEFTNNRLTVPLGNQQRQWAYITAPDQGWISLGIVGGSFNLGGHECG